MSTFVKLFRSIWQDSEYLHLSASQQRLYLLLISQPDISHCGVLPITAGRWARLAADTTPELVRTDLAALEAARFIECDWSTEELLVRTYMSYDGLHKIHNGDKALATAAARILSPALANSVRSLLAPPTKAPTEAPKQAPTEQPQQTTNNKQQTTSNNNTGPVAHINQLSDLPAAAAAAARAYIRHACDRPGVRNPAGLARTIERRVISEHAAQLIDYVTQHPAADWQTICQRVLGMTELDTYRAQIIGGTSYAQTT